METTTLYILCRSNPQWKPTEEELMKILHFFNCNEFSTVSVTSYSEEVLDEYDDIVFYKNETTEHVTNYYRQHPAQAILLMLDSVSARRATKGVREIIDENIEGNWIPWQVGVTIGPHPIPDVYAMQSEVRVYCSVAIHGDGMPKDISACHRLISVSVPVRSLCEFMETLNGEEWQTHMSCSF